MSMVFNMVVGGGGGKPKKLLSSLTEGSLVSVLEDGKLVPFYVAKHNYQPDLNGEGRTLLVRKYLHSNRRWNSTDVNTYANSEIDNWLNSDYKNLLSGTVKSQMGVTQFEYTIGGGDKTVSFLSRAVFQLSVSEFGLTGSDFNVEGKVLPTASLLKVGYAEGGTSAYQWTRTPRTAVTTQVKIILSNGAADQYSASSDSSYARPCFTLPANMALNTEPYADGSWGLADEYEPTDTVDITENGIHNVKIFSFANVNVAPVLLWTNASPASAFAAQTVTLPAGYSGYIVEVNYSIGVQTSKGCALVYPSSVYQGVAVSYPNVQTIYTREIRSVSDGAINFGYEVSGRADFAIPARIWGVKFTL